MDRRVARATKSKEALKAAYMELLRTKEPGEITVVELCEKAGLNRSTFYAHYEYMDRLTREVLWENVASLFEGFETQWTLPLEDGGVERKVIAFYLQRFLNNPTVLRFCTCKSSGNYRSLIIRAHVELMLGPVTDPVRYYSAYYHNAGVLNLLLEWLNRRIPISQEDMVELMHQFSKVMYRDIK